MNNHTAKEILSAYRPNGEDAHDPKFREALAHCEQDPAMKTWLADQLSFDREAARALKSIRGPDEGSQSILATLPFDETNNSGERKRFWAYFSGIGMAAVFIISILLGTVFYQAAPEIASDRVTLSQLADSAMPFDFTSSETNILVAWLEERDAPTPDSLPSAFRNAEAVGCKVFEDPIAGAISLICLEVDNHVFHVFTFEKDPGDLIHGTTNQWWKERGWNLITLDEGSARIVLATQSDPETISTLV